jgi:xanthine dehydrogenase accessory factor
MINDSNTEDPAGDERGVFAEAHRLESLGHAFALAFIIESRGSTPRDSGRMLIRLDGSTVGTVGGGPLEAQVIAEALEALKEGTSRTVRRSLTPEGADAAGMECGGTMAVRIDVSKAPPRLLLVGGGHVNLAVARAAAPMGFSVEVAESRPEFCGGLRFPMARAFHLRDDLIEAVTAAGVDGRTYVVIATHDDDIRVLGAVAGSGAAYIGMLGSKRKVAVAMASLRKRGVGEDVIAGIRAPVGLDIGAKTPAEIAVSIMAEILKVRSGRGGLPLQGMSKDMIVVRGAGDLATGVAWRLRRCGFQVVMLEIPQPTVIRRSVAFATALREGRITVEGIQAVKADDLTGVYEALENGQVPVLADPGASSLKTLKPAVVVDAILAKKNLGTTLEMAPAVIALGPGFTAGKDCHAVVETARGHMLGRVITEGSAMKNTGTPGIIEGRGAERVLRSPADGVFYSSASLGDLVKAGDVVAGVHMEKTPDETGPEGKSDIKAPFDGKLRGLLRDGIHVTKGFKVGDVDPRGEEVDENLISDKARSVAGGVLEAVLMLRAAAAGR